MTKKQFKSGSSPHHDLETTMQQCLLNLEEFALYAAEHCDQACFDIVAITRMEPEPRYTKHQYHGVIDTQEVRVSNEASLNQVKTMRKRD